MARLRAVVSKLLVVALVVGLGAGAWFGVRSEAFQRALGKRESTRVVADQVRPTYDSVVVEQSLLSIVPGVASTRRDTSTFTVDRGSQRVREVVTAELTGLDAAQSVVSVEGLEAVPGPDRIWTMEQVFTEGATETDGWSADRGAGRGLLETFLGPYLVPVMNDVIGLELAGLAPQDPATIVPADGADAPPVPLIVPTSDRLGTDVTDVRRWSMSLGELAARSPVALAKTPFGGLPTDTASDVTMGFDAAGVLRYLMVTVDPMKVPPAPTGAQIFGYEWRVSSFGGPETIELPTNVGSVPVPG